MNYEVTDHGESRTGIPIKRITWDDGKWWDVLAKMPQKVESANRIIMASLAKVEVTKDTIDSGPDSSKDATAWAGAAEKIRTARVKGCTVAWSWADPVSDEMLGDHDPDRVKDVFDVMDRLHAPDVEGVSEQEKKDSASRSSITALSGANGSQQSST